jgi:hypothetical protein
MRHFPRLMTAWGGKRTFAMRRVLIRFEPRFGRSDGRQGKWRGRVGSCPSPDRSNDQVAPAVQMIYWFETRVGKADTPLYRRLAKASATGGSK